MPFIPVISFASIPLIPLIPSMPLIRLSVMPLFLLWRYFAIAQFFYVEKLIEFLMKVVKNYSEFLNVILITSSKATLIATCSDRSLTASRRKTLPLRLLQLFSSGG